MQQSMPPELLAQLIKETEEAGDLESSPLRRSIRKAPGKVKQKVPALPSVRLVDWGE